MGDVIVLLIIVILLILAIIKVVKEKRKGNKCIGCPHDKGCSNSCNINIKK